MKKAPHVRLSLRKLFVAMLAVGPVAILPAPLLAAPPVLQPFVVTNGTATWTVSGAVGNVTSTDRSVLVWNAGQFNIASGDIYTFNLPSGGAVLNKVGYLTNGQLGASDNAIVNGTLTSNGRVFVLANGGIQIGGGASIQVANGLVLSTLQEPDTFTFTTTGNLSFTGTSAGSITLGNTVSQVNAIGNLSAWSSSVSPNNLSVSGDLVINQTSNSALSLTGSLGGTTVGGNLSATTANGTITQDATTGLSVGGLTTLSTGSTGNTSVSLGGLLNNFSTVQVNAPGTQGNVSLFDTSAIALGASSIGGSLTVGAVGNITSTGAVVVAGNENLNSTGVGGVNVGNNSSVGGTLNATATNGVVFSGIGNLTTGTLGGVNVGASLLTAGTGYITTTPTVVISAPPAGGVQATGVATINTSTGFVTSITITNPGAGYTVAPSVTLLGGSPSLAATASGSISGVSAPVSITTTGAATLNGAINSVGTNVTVTAPSINQTATGVIGATANVVTYNATGGNVILGPTTANRLNITANGGSITQNATGVLTTTSGLTQVFNAGSTGNITLTNNNVLTNALLALTGNTVSVTSTSNATLTATTTTGNLNINTSPSLFGAGNVTLGSGQGSAATGVTVGGGLNITTNGSLVTDDVSSNQSVFGAVTINNNGAGYGVLATLNATNGGAGYVNAPTVVIAGASGATATATVNTSGAVSAITITNAGTGGFNSLPAVTFVGGGTPGTVASGITPTLNNTILTAISAPTTPGVGYVTAPTVTISAPATGGIQATATAQVNTTTGVVTGFTITNPGLNYTAAPTFTLTGGGAPTTAATAGGTIAIGGNVSFTASTGGFGAKTSYGQFNITSNNATIQETQTISLGSVTTNTITVNSASGSIVFNGNLTTNVLSANANTGSISQVGAITTAGTSGAASFRTSNSFSTNLSNTSNSFGGAVTVTQGLNNIIVSGSNFTLASGTCVTSGNLTIQTVDAFNNTITIAGGNAIGVTANSAGNIAVQGGTFRNLTLTASNNITQSAGFQSNNTLTLASGGNVTLANTSNNLTNVVLNGTSGDTQVSSNRNLTISGNSAGNVTADAGIGSTTSFANPWNLTLGNLNVKSLQANARNGVNSTNVALNGASGNITQVAGSNIHSENGATFWTWGGNIIVANNGNSFGSVNLDTLNSSNGSTGTITFVEDSTLRLNRIDTSGNTSITSRFGSIIEDAAGAFINVAGASSVLSLTANNASIALGGLTNNNTTTGNVVNVSATALGSAAVRSSGNLTLGSIAVNSLTAISGNNIAQSAALKVFALATFNATNNITLTNADNNFGPISLTTQTVGTNVAITEAGTLNLRSVNFPGGGNGTFTANSINGDIIDTGLGGVKPAGLTASPGSGIITLLAVNGNIILDDPTTDLPTSSGVTFNAKNVTLSVLGGVGSNLVVGSNGTTSVATGNLTASSALGNIGNAGALSIGGTGFFQTGNGNITIGQPNVNFGNIRFIGNQVSIAEASDTTILSGSTAYGLAQIQSAGAITIDNSSGSVVSFGNNVGLSATGNITLKSLQAVGNLTVTSPSTKDLSALSLSADLNSKTPIDAGTGAGPSTVPALAPKP